MAKQDNSTLYMILAAAAAGLLLLSKPKPPLPYGMFSGVYKGNTVVITYEGHKYTFTGTTYSAWPINVVVRVTDTSYSITEDKEGGATIGAAAKYSSILFKSPSGKKWGKVTKSQSGIFTAWFGQYYNQDQTHEQVLATKEYATAGRAESWVKQQLGI